MKFSFAEMKGRRFFKGWSVLGMGTRPSGFVNWYFSRGQSTFLCLHEERGRCRLEQGTHPPKLGSYLPGDWGGDLAL